MTMRKVGNIYLYVKQDDRIEELQYVLQNISVFYKHNEIYISREPRRSFGELEKIKETITEIPKVYKEAAFQSSFNPRTFPFYALYNVWMRIRNKKEGTNNEETNNNEPSNEIAISENKNSDL